MNKLIALAIVAGLGSMAFADGNTASTSANASVVILAPVTAITDGKKLDFGKVIVPTAGGIVSISSTGALTASNGASIYKQNTGGTVPTFTLTKDASAPCTVGFSWLGAGTNSGMFAVDPSVTANFNTFAGAGTSLVQPIFGSLSWSSVPTPSSLAYTGVVTCTVAYN